MKVTKIDLTKTLIESREVAEDYRFLFSDEASFIGFTKRLEDSHRKAYLLGRQDTFAEMHEIASTNQKAYRGSRHDIAKNVLLFLDDYEALDSAIGETKE